MNESNESSDVASLPQEKPDEVSKSPPLWFFRPYPVKFLDHIEQLLAFSFFAICGCMARLGLEALTDFEQGGVLWPNFAGCLLMGLSTNIFGGALHLLHGTGFCGTLTSFSSFIVSLFHICTEPQASWPTYGYGVPVLFAQLIIQVAVSSAGYEVGCHLASFIIPFIPTDWIRKPVHEANYRRLLSVCGLLAWIAVLVLAIVLHNRNYPLAAVFSPLGMYVRYYLSRLNRGDLKWGTLAANLLGTALASMFDVLSDWRIASTTLQKQFLYAVSNGFCGCLSTVSTLMSELHALPMVKSYLYGFASFGTACCIAVIIMGSYYWTR